MDRERAVTFDQDGPGSVDLSLIAMLSAEFAWRVDHRAGVGVSDMFEDGGRYGYPGFWLEGRAAIDAFYSERRARGARLSRHIFTNHRVFCDASGQICASAILTLFAADGDGPHAANPLSIMDYHDVLIRSANGHWRYQERRVSPIFGHMPILAAAQSAPAAA